MEMVLASDFDKVVEELDAALAALDRFKASTSYGFVRGRGKPKPEEKRIEVKTRMAPLDVSAEQHPL